MHTRMFLLSLFAFYLCACAGNSAKPTKYISNISAIPSDSVLNLKLPVLSTVPFHGEVCFDDAGQKAGGFLYPAPNAAGLLAAIATHATISNAINESQKSDIQKKADAVLDPYEIIIDGFSYQELTNSCFKKLGPNNKNLIVDTTSNRDQPWTLESLPVFILSQDKNALIVQNTVAVYATGSPSSVVYKNMIQIISNRLDSEDIERYWKENEGANLKNTSADLFAESLKIALNEIRKNGVAAENPYQTFRYQEGKNEKYERGQLIATTCNRIVIRTLRGWIMSVPVKDDTSCQNNL